MLIYRNDILHLLQNLYKKIIYLYTKICNQFESLGRLTITSFAVLYVWVGAM